MALVGIGLLFLCGALYNLFVTGDIENAVLGFIVAFTLFLTYYVKNIENKKLNEFTNWICCNENDI